jgi:glycosyltransferase involved in cell wall biosynthesis
MQEQSKIQGSQLPGVSVIIPAYNYAKFLPFAVESALNQDYPEYEILVIDDGSKDHTREIMEKYEAPVRYIYKDNAGLSAARNTGIEKAKYDYVAFLDADDEFRPGILRSSMSKFVELGESFSLVTCDNVFIDIDGKPLTHVRHIASPSREVTVKDILLRTRFSPTGAFARKTAFDSCGDFDTTLRSTEDRDMWIRIAAKQRVYFQGEVLVHIRKHGNNMSNNAVQQSSNMVVVLKKAQRSGAVPQWQFWFWLKVFAYQRYQAALIFNGIRKPLPAFWNLFLSMVYWPLFLNPAYYGCLPLFRVRQLVSWSVGQLVSWSVGQLVSWSVGQMVRFSLNVLRGEVKH